MTTPLLALAAKSFSSKIWLCQSLNIMVSYHCVKYQKKTKDLMLGKFSERRTDGRWTGAISVITLADRL